MPDVRTVLLLGGSGEAGRPLASLLLRETRARVIIAGRNLLRARAVADSLGRAFPGRVSAAEVDAADPKSVVRAVMGVDLLVVAASVARHTAILADACMARGVDWFDLMYAPQREAVLAERADEIRDRGRCFITDGGLNPGLPAVLVRQAARYVDRLERADVAAYVGVDWRRVGPADATAEELVDALRAHESGVIEDGRWRRLGIGRRRGIVSADLGVPYGRRSCHAASHEVASISIPTPTMTRNAQNTGSTGGWSSKLSRPRSSPCRSCVRISAASPGTPIA